MTSCVIGRWYDRLDLEDRNAFNYAIERRSRADLYGLICAAEGRRPFGLTALKDHLNDRCKCDGESS